MIVSDHVTIWFIWRVIFPAFLAVEFVNLGLRVFCGYGRSVMMGWSMMFFMLAIIAAILGFGGIVTGTLMVAAKATFVVFVLCFLLSFVFGRSSSPGPSIDPTAPDGY